MKTRIKVQHVYVDGKLSWTWYTPQFKKWYGPWCSIWWFEPSSGNFGSCDMGQLGRKASSTEDISIAEAKLKEFLESDSYRKQPSAKIRTVEEYWYRP